MEKQRLKNIPDILKEQRAFDFTGYHESMLERRIQKRITATNNKNFDDYFEYLNRHPDELDNLIDVFTINVSRFFRNSLSFEYINKILIPELFNEKTKANDNNIRIWSAGCSFGEAEVPVEAFKNKFKRENRIAKIYRKVGE